MPLPRNQYMPASAQADLAGRATDLKTGGLPELLRKAGKEMYDNPVVNTAISLTPGAGDLQSGLEALASAREGDWTGAALNGVGVLPFVPALSTVKALREAEGVEGSARTLDDVVKAIENKGIKLDLYQSSNKPNKMTLSRIEVPSEMRGQGAGSDAMNQIVDYATQNGKTVTLSPSTSFGGSSVNRLKDFYKRFGFVENKGRNKDFEISESMYFQPK